MRDYFELLGQRRLPWLDPESITRAFISASAELHPDRVHNAPEQERRTAHERYTELNQAHLCLKDSRTRLRHLLELERGEKIKDLQEIPDDLMQLFMNLGRQLKSADVALAKAAGTESPLLKVVRMQEAEALRESLQHTQESLQERRQKLEAELQSLSRQWGQLDRGDEGGRTRLLERLETLYRLISFHARWLDQVQIRAAALSTPV